MLRHQAILIDFACGSIEAIRKSGGKLNQYAIPEMIEYLRRIGYRVSLPIYPPLILRFLFHYNHLVFRTSYKLKPLTEPRNTSSSSVVPARRLERPQRSPYHGDQRKRLYQRVRRADLSRKDPGRTGRCRKVGW
jgi:hypothetical protein